MAGTDPTDADSVLRVQLVSTPQGFQLTWNSQLGFVYQVWSSEDLVSWNEVSEPRFAPGGVDSVALHGPENGAYYRIVRLR